jgi:hypothetical protein
LYCLIPIVITIIAAVFIKRKEGLDVRAKLLYLVIFILEIPGSAVRAVISSFLTMLVFAPVWFVFGLVTLIVTARGYLTGDFTPPYRLIITFYIIGGGIIGIGGLIGGYGPLVWSLLCMLGLRGGNKETAWEMGGRRLSKTREAVNYGPRLAHIQSLARRGLKAPAAVFAIDSPLSRAWTVGSTLFMTSELLKGKHLMPVVCRNLYYLESGDSRFCLALRRLVMPPAYIFSRFKHHLAPGNLAFAALSAVEERYAPLALYTGTFLGSLAGGGLGIILMSPLIVRYLKGAQGRANIWATEIGLGNPLVDYYEGNAHFDFAVPYIYRPLSSTELQIDDIIRWQRGERW